MQNENQEIHEPHENDFLCGKGNAVQYHKGNIYLRERVKEHLDEYLACRAGEKKEISKKIYDLFRDVQNPPGRFLKQNKETNTWFEITEVEALDKIANKLRDRKKQLNKEDKLSPIRKSLVVQKHQANRSLSESEHSERNFPESMEDTNNINKSPTRGGRRASLVVHQQQAQANLNLLTEEMMGESAMSLENATESLSGSLQSLSLTNMKKGDDITGSTRSFHDSFRDDISAANIGDGRRRSLLEHRQPANHSLKGDRPVCRNLNSNRSSLDDIMSYMSKISYSISNFSATENDKKRKASMASLSASIKSFFSMFSGSSECVKDVSMRSGGSSSSDESREIFEAKINEVLQSLDAVPEDIQVELMRSFNEEQDASKYFSKHCSDLSMGSSSPEIFFQDLLKSGDSQNLFG